MVEKKKRAKEDRMDRKGRKDFSTQEAYLDYQVKYWEDRKEDYLANRDGRRARKKANAERMIKSLKGMQKNDPELAAMIAELTTKKSGKE